MRAYASMLGYLNGRHQLGERCVLKSLLDMSLSGPTAMSPKVAGTTAIIDLSAQTIDLDSEILVPKSCAQIYDLGARIVHLGSMIWAPKSSIWAPESMIRVPKS